MFCSSNIFVFGFCSQTENAGRLREIGLAGPMASGTVSPNGFSSFSQPHTPIVGRPGVQRAGSQHYLTTWSSNNGLALVPLCRIRQFDGVVPWSSNNGEVWPGLGVDTIRGKTSKLA